MKKIILLLIAIIGIQNVNAQINFSSQINGSSVTFILTQQGQFYEIVEWDFGDGIFSQGSNEMQDTVTHVYSSIGNYKICVVGSPMPIATNDTACKFVNIITTGINQIEKNSIIIICPNPTTGQITLSNLPQEASNITIYNVLGKLVYEEETAEHQIDLSGLSSGVYMLHLTDGYSTFRKKIIKL